MNTQPVITDEMLAAYIAGNASVHEVAQILRAVQSDPVIRETLTILAEIDAEEEQNISPMMAMAADDCEQANRCAIRCEAYVLRNIGLTAPVDELIREAEQKGWVRGDGMPVYNIGRLCESHGLTVTCCDECTIDDIANALRNHQQVIAVVDTSGDGIPNHSVVVTTVNENTGSENTLTIFDPDTAPETDLISSSRFEHWWQASERYMILIDK